MAKKAPKMQVSRFTATGMYAGLEFTLTFLLFLGLGYMVDLKLGTGIGFLANGAVIGFLVGLYRLNRQGRQVMAEGEKELKEAREARDEEARQAAGQPDSSAPMGDRPKPGEKVRTAWGADQRARLTAPEHKASESEQEGDDGP